MLNLQGERFEAEPTEGLPALNGPDGSEHEVAERFRRFSGAVEPLGSAVVRVALSPRYSWQLSLANGLQIVLGRDSPSDPVEQRLSRFVAAAPETLGRLNRRNEYVDLRYPNGFALRVPELARAAAPRRTGEK
jgi:cell division protein FtsQ